MNNQKNIHQGQPVLQAGQPLEQAKAALLLVHGRGASAQSILTLADELPHPEFAYLAPQAANGAWYPNRFIAPIESNEPYLTSALEIVGGLIQHITDAGIPPERIILLGFSQGACLAQEYAARNPQRYGGLVGLSGGLIGPIGMEFSYPGSGWHARISGLQRCRFPHSGGAGTRIGAGIRGIGRAG